MNVNNFLTVQELAKLVNVPESWVRRQVFIKNVPFIKVGHYIRFNKDEIQNWLTTNSNQINKG